MKKLLIILLIFLLTVPAVAIEIENLKLGGQVRFREYDLRNFWTFDDDAQSDEWKTFRLKTSLSASADVGEDVSGMIRLTNQTYGEGIDDAKDNKSNKVFVDNAYIDVNNIGSLPLNLRIGRQNLMYGSGFVLFDGQSQYASTSVYFDGIKASLVIGEGNTLDILYVKDQENTPDETVHDDVTLSGLYLTMDKMLPCKTEAYGLYRLDEGKYKEIFMVGARVSDKLDMGLDYSLEGAFQFGETTAADLDHEAFGGKADVGFTFDAPVKPRVFAQYAYMSGDDPDSKTCEGWDVFYGGWPQFGDLLAWAFVAAPSNNTDDDSNAIVSTGGEAAYSNFSIATLGIGMAPVEKMSCKLSGAMIQWNEAPEEDFGTYVQLTLGYKYSKNLSFSLYAAQIYPGDAFKATAEDTATEIYYEADLRF